MLRAELQIINLFEGFWRLISFRREKSQLGKKVLLLQEVNKYQFLSHSSICRILLSSLHIFFSYSSKSCSHFFSIFLPFFLTLSLSVSPDTISASLSLSRISLHPILFSISIFFLSWSNCMYTPGCRGNQRRPHERVDEQKTQRPSYTERERERKSERERRKIRFHF